MSPVTSSPPLSAGTRLAGYVLESVLGRGGSAHVYRARDRQRRVVALKLLPQKLATERPDLAAAFRREFLHLEQLKHPRIVEVYEYGSDPHGLYYTMELLDSELLHDVAPLHPRRACQLLRDVALSLAIMHSRRMVHRDVSAGNVGCDASGRAKLLDFGAAMAFGVPDHVVGTPQYMAPETLGGEPLDARADLFALGALGYWMITGKQAYPATSIAHLPHCWKAEPAPPSSLAPDVPEPLDELLSSLLCLDLNGRPKTATEVINRLEAIAGLTPVARVEAAEAMFVAPRLTGRGAELALFEQAAAALVKGRGASIVVEGPPGVGRTRLLHQVAIEASRPELLVLRPLGHALWGKPYGVCIALGEAALTLAPDLARDSAAPHRAVLRHLLAQLSGDQESPPEPLPRDDVAQRRLMQQALHDWFVAIAARRPLMLLVDDLHRCDEPSAAVLTSLASGAPKQRMLFVASRRTDAVVHAPHALQKFTSFSRCVELRELDRGASEELAGSVFGHVPNLKLVTEWMHDLGGGNPGQSVALLQYLVDRQVVQYADGVWTLPEQLRHDELPQTVAEALDARLENLAPEARELAEILCVLGRPMRRTLLQQSMRQRQAEGAEARFERALGELQAKQVVGVHQGAHAFSHHGMAAALLAKMDERRRREVHAHIGQATDAGLAKPPADPRASLEESYDWALGGYHLMKGGLVERGIELWMGAVRYAPDHGHFPIWEGNEWYVEANLMALQALEQRPGSAVLCTRVRTSLIQCAIHVDHRYLVHAEPMLDHLEALIGIPVWRQLADEPDPRARIRRSIAAAFEAFHALPRAEQDMNPMEAVRDFVGGVVSAANICAHTLDIAYLRKLARRLEPLQAVSTAIRFYQSLVEAIVERTRGRVQREVDLRVEALCALDTDDVQQGANSVALGHLRGFTFFALGMLESARCPRDGLARAAQMEVDTPFMEFEAWQVRLLAHLYDGNASEAHACWERMEMAAVTGGAAKYQMHTAGLQHVAEACALVGDLMGLKHTIGKLRPLADDLATWRPFYDAARAQYSRLRGRLSEAREEAVRAVDAVECGEHRGWAFAVVTLLQVELEQGELEAARVRAARALGLARAVELGPEPSCQLESLLGLCEVRLGHQRFGRSHVEHALEIAESYGISGVLFGQLHERAARVAIARGDAPAFEHHAEQMARHCCNYDTPSLIAGHRQLLEDARAQGLAFGSERAGQLAYLREGNLRAQVRQDYLERSESGHDAILAMILERSGARDGLLYQLIEDELCCVASTTAAPPRALTAMLLDYLRAYEPEDNAPFTHSETATMSAVWREPSGQLFMTAVINVLAAGSLRPVGALALQVDEHDVPQLPEFGYLLAVGELLAESTSIAEASAPLQPPVLV